MRVVIGLIVLTLVGGLAGIAYAPQLDPLCVVQKLQHAAADDRPGWDCLAFAAARGDARIAAGMLAHGHSADSRSNDGRTPLMIAAAHGHLQLVALLLQHAATINLADRRGRTALHFAARHGHAAVVRRLL